MGKTYESVRYDRKERHLPMNTKRPDASTGDAVRTIDDVMDQVFAEARKPQVAPIQAANDLIAMLGIGGAVKIVQEGGWTTLIDASGGQRGSLHTGDSELQIQSACKAFLDHIVRGLAANQLLG